MDTPDSSSASQTPIQLLESQVKLLEAINEEQKALNAKQVELIQTINELKEAQEDGNEKIVRSAYGIRGLVAITDFDIPFWSLVEFMIKLVLASIPAAIILGIIYFIISVVLVGILR
jgi:hypothetical protein